MATNATGRTGALHLRRSPWRPWALLLAHLTLAARAVAAPGDLDVAGFNAADPVVGNRGKVTARLGVTTSANDTGAGVARQPDGKLLIAGSCDLLLTRRPCVARFNADGTPDTSFNPNAATQGSFFEPGEKVVQIVTTQWYDGRVALQPDGKIVLAGTCGDPTSGFNDFCIVRLLPNGDEDITFNAGGAVPGLAMVAPGNFFNTARDVVLQGDGKIVVAGGCGTSIIDRAMCVSRHHANGTLDTSFNAGGPRPGTRVEPIGDGSGAEATAIALQADGKLLLGGGCYARLANDFCLMRLHADGTLDTGFASDAGGKRITSVADGEDALMALAVQPNGSIVAAGACATGWVFSNNGVTRFCAVRYLADGTLDSAGFNASALAAGRGMVQIDMGSGYDGANALLRQADGKLLLVGRCNADQATGTGVLCLARLASDGSLDASFGSGGKALAPAIANQRDLVNAALLQADGKIVAAGSCFRGAPEVFCAARFEGGPVAAPTCALNVDGNLLLDAATDGVLIVRYLLGLRGAALTAGALGANPQRTGTALESWLAGLDLDADGDGVARAATDGLLLLRALAGASDVGLSTGAVNTGHPNARTAAQIRSWITSTHGADCLP